ncbi:MAG: CCA tRNA nucleotidyltransferase [Hyphomicrobiales bacterium]
MAKTARRDMPSLAGAPWLVEPRLQHILAVLSEGGGEARIAGGAIRNALLGVAVADVDIATTLLPPEVMRRGAAAGFGVHPTGLDHGTVTLVCQHLPVEVTTLRRDVSTDGRRASVAFTTDWAEDAERRDFTINAMYCDAAGQITDYTNGCDDIRKRCVRFVGRPSRRIREDYLRILRFFRFHAHYGRGPLQADGLAACRRLRKGITTLSAERITQEMLKLLAAPKPWLALKAMEEAGILRLVLPGLPDWRVIKRLPLDPLLRLFALNGQSANVGGRFRLSNPQKARLQKLEEAPAITPEFRPNERHKMIYHLGAAAFADAVSLTWARSRAPLSAPEWQELAELPRHWVPPTFPVNGKDLQQAGLAAGPGLGRALRELEDWWIASDFAASREDLLKHLET